MGMLRDEGTSLTKVTHVVVRLKLFQLQVVARHYAANCCWRMLREEGVPS